MRLIAVFLWLCLVQIALPKRGGSSGGRGSSSRESGSGSGGEFFTKGGRSYLREIPVTVNRQYTSQFKNTLFSPNLKILTGTTTNTYIIKERSPYFSYGSHYYHWGPLSGIQHMKTCRFVFEYGGEERKKQQKAYEVTKKYYEVKEKRNDLEQQIRIHKDAYPERDNYNIIILPNFTRKYESKRQKWKEKLAQLRQELTKIPLPPKPGTIANNETVTYAIEEFGKVQFENGTQVKEVSFRCKWDQVCCGMECCDKRFKFVCDGDCSIDWHFIVDIIFLIIIIIVGCYNCFARLVKGDREYTVVEQTTTVTERVEGLGGPSKNSYEFLPAYPPDPRITTDTDFQRKKEGVFFY